MNAVITQRESIDRYGEPMDVLEAAYTTYFQNLGITLFPVSNYCKTPTKYLDNADLLILTGGGDIPSRYYADRRIAHEQVNRDRVEAQLVEYCFSHGIPILAICRGMQFVNGLLGGKVRSLNSVGAVYTVRQDHPVLLCAQNRKIWVNHYHNDCILKSDLADELKIIALDECYGVVEAFACADKKLLAFQWHPERVYEDPINCKDTDRLIKEFIVGGNTE